MISNRNQIDRDHAESCRRCGAIYRRSDMIRAAKVNGNPKARGFFCHFCASNNRRHLRR